MKVTTALLFQYAAPPSSMRFLLRINTSNLMKTTNPYTKIALLFLAVGLFTAVSARADTYSWTNFQSDIPGVAQHVDPNLVNPWGMSVSAPNGTIWVSDNGTGVSTLYGQDGTAVPLVVDDSNGRAEQRRRQSHWTSLQRHAVLPSDKKWKLGARFLYFCQ